VRAFFTRLAVSLPVLLGITVISFFIIHMAPGDPVDMLISPEMPTEMLETTRARLGLDRPGYVQYFAWLGQVLKGNLGYSFRTYEPVSRMIGDRIGPTLRLAGTALLASLLIAVIVGIWSALNKDLISERLVRAAAFLCNCIPAFFLGLVLIYFFTLKLRIFPSSGMKTLGSGGGFVDSARHLFLPAAVMTINTVCSYMRYVRVGMIDALKEDYIRTARAKGLSRGKIIFKHALRNALIPFITVIGNHLPAILSGALVTEQVFSWPGLGQLMMSSIQSRDYPVLMSLMMMTAIATVASNLFVDLIYAIVDPRIRYS
jgi:peptide/nickel transport system permease protein